MSKNSDGPPSLFLVAKPGSTLMPRVLSEIIPEFIGRDWGIFGEAPVEGAWAEAGLPLDKLTISLPNAITLGLALGGDGTMLRAARQIGPYGVPLLGINLGFLGFLTHPVAQASSIVQKYFAGQLVQDRRGILHVSLCRGGAEISAFDALNDAVVAKGPLSRVLRLELMIEDNLAADLRADGLIVATPTGSTAYALSAGGPILHPTLNAWTMAPICPHSLNMRPCVIPSHMAVTVALSDAEEAHLTLDGQVGCPIQPGDIIKMYDAGGQVTLMQDPQVPFFALLRQKMHWNKE
jgi:NAD+ kinase